MIVSRTPLRISFVGGGSDLPSYYKQSGGAVLSTSVDKYIYVTVNQKFDNDIRLSYSITENESNIKQIKHPFMRLLGKFSHHQMMSKMICFFLVWHRSLTFWVQMALLELTFAADALTSRGTY